MLILSYALNYIGSKLFLPYLLCLCAVGAPTAYVVSSLERWHIYSLKTICHKNAQLIKTLLIALEILMK